MAKVPIPDRLNGLRVVTAAQMQSIDRQAIDAYRISASFLMERAGQGVAGELERFTPEALGKELAQLKVAIICGRGNNGGDGLVVARLLKKKALGVRVAILGPKDDRPYGREVFDNLEKAKDERVALLEVQKIDDLPPGFLEEADLVVDALLGTGASGKPAGVVKDLIQAMNRAKKPVVAIDIPSGLHPDTGHHSGVFVTAVLTIALGLPKRGLLAVHAQKNIGKLVVVDIGLPSDLTA